MYAQPGKKLLFMGGEFGQWSEWYHDVGLDWHLLDQPSHAGLQRWVQDLNRVYRAEPGLHRLDFEPAGFEWIDCNDSQQGVLSMMRKGIDPGDTVLAVFNFTPVPRHAYRIGAPAGGFWQEILNSDAADYGGGGIGNSGGVTTEETPFHGRPRSLLLTLPPLAALFFRKGV